MTHPDLTTEQGPLGTGELMATEQAAGTGREFETQVWTPFPGLRVRATGLGGRYAVEVWRQRPDGSWPYAVLRDEFQDGQWLAEWRVET